MNQHIYYTQNYSVLTSNGVYITRIHCASCSTLDDCYTVFSNAFQFPDYFGYNLDALEDMLLDLDWMEADSIVVQMVAPNEFLQSESTETKQEVWELLRNLNNPRLVFIWEEKM